MKTVTQTRLHKFALVSPSLSDSLTRSLCTSSVVSRKTNHIQSVQEQDASTKHPIQLVNPATLPQIVCRML